VVVGCYEWCGPCGGEYVVILAAIGHVEGWCQDGSTRRGRREAASSLLPQKAKRRVVWCYKTPKINLISKKRTEGKREKEKKTHL
jgi:hypothetical protein